MQQRLQSVAFQSVGRTSGIVGLVLGSFLCNLAKMPFAMLKAGGLLSLVIAVAMILLADRAVQARFQRSRIWAELAGPQTLRTDDARVAVGRAVRDALRRHAFWYAVAAAAFLALLAAAQAHLQMYPVPA